MRQLVTSRILTVIGSAAVLALPVASPAQSLQEFHDLGPEERRAYWESLSEQERQAKREEWRSERDAMSVLKAPSASGWPQMMSSSKRFPFHPASR